MCGEIDSDKVIRAFPNNCDDYPYGPLSAALYIKKVCVGILALSTCTNITCSGTYAVLKLVVVDV